jgi:Holliday junction DNA helicase RuvA
MIDYVRGVLAEKQIAQATVEAGGVGYEILIPFSTFEQLPQPGAEVRLLTHHYVREDMQKLYGFYTAQERELFRQLIAVSSIGPKTALSILSKISVNDLAKCVEIGDPARLTRIPGIGAKTAQRLMVELRGKLTVAAGAEQPRAKAKPGAKQSGSSEEAFEALMSLGYNDKQVVRAIERVNQTIEAGEELPVEEFIKKALQVI